MTCTDAQSHILKRKYLTFILMTSKTVIYLNSDIFCPALSSNLGDRLSNLITEILDLTYTHISTHQLMYLKIS